MSAHTPGPWFVRRGSGCLHVVSQDDAMHTGCITFDGRGIANARLIAAAPELLDALRDLVERADRSELADGSSLDTLRANVLLDIIDKGGDK